MSNFLPENFYSPNDAADLLCEALVNLKFKPEAVNVNFKDGTFSFLGINLEGEQELPFFMMLGNEIADLLTGFDGEYRRSKLFCFLQDLGMPFVSKMNPQIEIKEGYVVWCGIPLVKN